MQLVFPLTDDLLQTVHQKLAHFRLLEINYFDGGRRIKVKQGRVRIVSDLDRLLGIRALIYGFENLIHFRFFLGVLVRFCGGKADLLVHLFEPPERWSLISRKRKTVILARLGDCFNRSGELFCLGQLGYF